MSAEDELQEVLEQLQGYGNNLPPFDTLRLYLRIVCSWDRDSLHSTSRFA
jgi:hypothetical protein